MIGTIKAKQTYQPNGIQNIFNKDMNNTSKKRDLLRIALHVLAWAIFLSLPTFFKPHRPGEPVDTLLNDLLFTPRLPNALLLIAVFYFNYYVAIPQYYFRKRYMAMFISFVVSAGIFVLINEFMRPMHLRGGEVTLFTILGPSHNLFMFMNVYGFSWALRLYDKWRQVREEQLNTEISFLKAQINPHFLFNTLNSIYSLTITQSDKAPDAVVKLSSLMRYTITDANSEKVPLSKEIAYINDLIELQKLRLTEQVAVDVEIRGDMKHEIAPLILTPFIENAFKTGVNSEEGSRIVVRILVEDSILHMTVENSKVYVQEDELSVTGLDIKNTEKRLRYIYPGKHTLAIDDGDDHYRVSLQMELA